MADFDGPAHPGCPDEFPESLSVWVVAVVVGEFAVVDGTPDHVVVAGLARIEQRPVVDAESFAADAAGPALPVVGPHLPGGFLYGVLMAFRAGESCVFRDGHHVGDLAFLQECAQARVLPEFLVGREPGERHPGVQGPRDHDLYLLRACGERQIPGDARFGTPVPVTGP